ncbi:OmpA family protein [Vibrio paucivorans]
MNVKLNMLASLVGLASSPLAANDLQLYCGSDNGQYEITAKALQGVRVHLDQGTFLQVSEDVPPESQKMLASELESIGVSSSCSEYFSKQGEYSELNQGELVARVHFSFDKSELTDNSLYVLNNLIKQIQATPSKLQVEGHTDSTGSEAYNFQLGLRRSDEVKQYLVSEGVNAEQLESVSHGASQPIEDNNDREGRAANRRVDITL